TEEGTLVPASYRSGHYEKWQEQNKVRYRNRHDDDDSTPSRSVGRGKKVWHTKGSKSQKFVRDELKNPEQIFKERRKKGKKRDLMENRRLENLKRKVGQLKGQRPKQKKPHQGGGRPKKKLGNRRK